MKESENRSHGLTAFLIGASLGAAAMYFLDPTRGNQRRAVARDKAISFTKRAGRRGEKIVTDLRNQAQGMKSEVQRHLRKEEVSDEILEQRVRSIFGRKVRHAKAIKVKVEEGTVILSGPILNREVRGLINSIESVPGVKSVQDELSKYENAGDISSLQGKGARYFQ
ncbi:BON domain-containing protein [Bdellovibrio sp. BCCA]|uniref:BON domain-containing protein n=1 Tax=Bdellovibrio sp. BCCA TaxID=3136281 RepID=UPI0030F0C67B